MAQRRFWQWQDDDLTIDLDRWLMGVIASGTYCGFDFSPTADLNLTLYHETTGFKYRKIDLSESDFVGMLVTQQGVIIQEDEPIVLPVTANNDSNPRIDIIVLSSIYSDDVRNGNQAEYSVIPGTPSVTPVAPSVPNAQTDIIVATLYMPGNTTALNATGVVYTKPNVPNFARVLNEYFSTVYVSNGDNIQRAVGKLDKALDIVARRYETNTLTTSITVSGEESKYAKFLNVDMPSVGDFYSAIIAITGGNKLNSNSEPMFGIFEIRVQQTSAFGVNPIVYIKALSGNTRASNFISGKIVDNASPSTVEFHVYAGAVIGNNFAIRVLSVNKSSGAIVTYFNNETWASLTGTIRNQVARKMFIRQVAFNFSGLVIGTDYLLPILTTPNDGKKRSFSFHIRTQTNFGSNGPAYLYTAGCGAYYTSSASVVDVALMANAQYWNGTADSQKNIPESGAFNFTNVDPGTTAYIKISTSAETVGGSIVVSNIQEVDADEFVIT